MNYLCVLGESIGHAGTLPAPLELGTRVGVASWAHGSRWSPQRGGSGAGSIRALERKPSLPEKEERALLKLRGKS